MVKNYSKTKGGDLRQQSIDEINSIFTDFTNRLGHMGGGKLNTEGMKEKKKRGRKPASEKGAGLLSDAFGALGPINPFNYINPIKLLGGGLQAPQKGKNQQFPMATNIASVPVDRVVIPVPGAGSSGVVPEGQTPLEQSISRMRKLQAKPPKAKVQGGALIPKRKSTYTPNPEGTDLRQMMKDFGQTLPKNMRNVKPGGKLSVLHLKKIYNHLADKHGVDKGGSLFSDIGNAFSKGFKMPFQALGAVANAII
jgi:hypothetical protein